MSIEEQQKLKAMAEMIKRYDAQQQVLRTMEQDITKACRAYEKVSGHRGLSIHSMRRELNAKGMLNGH